MSMKINWFGYWQQHDGYGRFNTRLVQALQRAGPEVAAFNLGELDRPAWLLDQLAIEWDRLSITCAPPYMLQRIPGRQWLYSMTEGSELPPRWVDCIAASGVERVLVPCQHNAEAFQRSGVRVPIHVLVGGTDPAEFPLLTRPRAPHQPYTFLCLADRGARKGWQEVWDAFYLAFGGKTTGTMDVRLIIKSVPTGNNVVEVMAAGGDLDKRIVYQIENVREMADVYAQADCVVLPSRSEGWGMPHREAAMMGIPVITQAYSGMDDGHVYGWASVVQNGTMQLIPPEEKTSLGEWRVVDVTELADTMRQHYEHPRVFAQAGKIAAAWLRDHQTWQHTATALIDLMRAHEPVLHACAAAFA